MNIDKENRFLNIFNRNLPLKNRYKTDEIKKAFSKESYSSGSQREQQLYGIFFTEFDNDKDIEDFRQLYQTTSRKINNLYKSFEDDKKREFGNYWSIKVTRKKLPLGNIKSRKLYNYIEKFQTYELTPCIAYEMAIRNDDVKALFKRYEKINHMMEDDIYLYKRFFTHENFENAKNHPIQTLSEEYENCTYEEYETIIAKKLATYKRLIEEDYKKFIDEYIHRCTELSISELNMLKEKIEEELINNYLIYPTGYIRDVPGATYFYKEEITNSKKDKNRTIITDKNAEDGLQIRFEEIIHDEFIQVQGTNIKDTKYYVNNIIPNFHRQVNDQNQINIPINFSLSIEEITEYIEKVKKKIDPKIPLELLGKKLEKANDLSNIKTENGTLNTIRGEKPQSKFADMFFIYDMKQEGHSYVDIIYELDKYYNKQTAISDNTIKKYFAIANEYIKNKRYKELITGKVVKK